MKSRIAVACILFLTSISLLGWYAVDYINSTKDFVIQSSSTPQEPGFFYQSVGATPQEPESPKKPKNLKSYTLEIKVVDNQQDAIRTIEMLASKGIEAFYTPLQQGGRVIYRIRKGIYPKPSLARKAAKELKNKAKVSSKVTLLR